MPATRPVAVVLDAEAELARRDPVLAGLVATTGPCTLGRRGFPRRLVSADATDERLQLADHGHRAFCLRAQLFARGRALFRWLTRYDLVFSASMALAVIALAIYAVPFPGNLVLVAAAALGVVGAVVAILRRGPNAERGRHGS